MSTPTHPDRFLKLAEVRSIVSMGTSSIYRRMDAGTFPRPFALGPATVRWKLSEIEGWIASLERTGAQ